MGKSNKKVKNERINAIRKQFDAFQEEDKKRRERNEYILGKLDKMRSSTALVPISTKANYHMDFNPSETLMRSNARIKPDMGDTYLSHLKGQNLTSGIINTRMDELGILKEISKKYILIPKRTAPIENNYVYSKDVIHDDWKSKYNILDDLKKLEKEGQSEPLFTQYSDDNNIHNKDFDLSMDSHISDKQPPNVCKEYNNFDQTIPEKYNELTATNPNTAVKEDFVNKQVNFTVPESKNQERKDSKITLQVAPITTDENIKVDQTQSINDIQEPIPQREDIIENEKYDYESSEKDSNSIKSSVDNTPVYEMATINHPTVNEETVHPSDYINSTDTIDKYIAPENINAVDMVCAAISDQTASDVKPQETGAVEYSQETVHLDRNSGKPQNISVIQDFTGTERVEIYNDVDNNPDSQFVANESTTDKPKDYDPAGNTIPVNVENIQHLDHVEHESEINAFEAEQKEMFYSEQSHADTYQYNQGDVNSGEYPEGYDPNDQYAYYEGVQQEQAYATEINEHEESTERYDPHYNQQYEGSYDNQQTDNTVAYDDSNIYEQQQLQGENQQFENVADYENLQENAHLYQQENVGNENEVQENVLPQDDQMYNQHLYAEQTDTQEHIEQQLITEEGYIQSPPAVTEELQRENEGYSENVIDTTNPQELTPEQKLS